MARLGISIAPADGVPACDLLDRTHTFLVGLVSTFHTTLDDSAW